jgi:sugar lactone lactonase YvrE
MAWFHKACLRSILGARRRAVARRCPGRWRRLLTLEALETRACPSTDLFVSSYATSLVLRYDGNTGAFLGTFARGRVIGTDLGLTYGPDNNLYVDGFDSHSVVRHNGATGKLLNVFVPPQNGGLCGAEGMAFGPDKNLYVSNDTTSAACGSTPGSVLRYDGTTGAFIDTFVPPNSGGLSQANDLHFGPDGRLYVSSANTNNILRYDAVTGAFIDEFVKAGSGGLDLANGFTWGRDGNLYVNSSLNNSVKRYDGKSGAYLGDFVPSGNGGLNFGDGLAFGPGGDLFVASFVTNSVKRYDGRTGAYLGDFVTPGSGGLTGAAAVLFRSTGGPGADSDLPLALVTAAAADTGARAAGVPTGPVPTEGASRKAPPPAEALPLTAGLPPAPAKLAAWRHAARDASVPADAGWTVWDPENHA